MERPSVDRNFVRYHNGEAHTLARNPCIQQQEYHPRRDHNNNAPRKMVCRLHVSDVGIASTGGRCYALEHDHTRMEDRLPSAWAGAPGRKPWLAGAGGATLLGNVVAVALTDSWLHLVQGVP